jgi:membrane fusion protein (multidrug efflux system)
MIGAMEPKQNMARCGVLCYSRAMDWDISGRRKVSRLRPFAVVLCAAAALTACKKVEAQRALPEATVMVAAYTSYVPVGQLTGQTVPHEMVEVRPQVNGRLDTKLFSDGTQVTAGQALFEIDPAPYRAAYDSAQAALESAQANLDLAQAKATRTADLLKQSAISKQDYDIAEAAFKQARTIVVQQTANLANAQFNLNNTTIRAPISGYIGRSLAAPGELVTAYQGTPLATIQGLNPIYVDVLVSSAKYAQLRRVAEARKDGKRSNELGHIKLLPDDGTAYGFEGKLELNNVAFDKSSGKVVLRGIFANPKMQVPPGMTVHLQYDDLERDQVILLPESAVVRDKDGGTSVLVVDSHDVTQKRPIEIDGQVGSRESVKSGLVPGDKVVLNPSPALGPKVLVHTKLLQGAAS